MSPIRGHGAPAAAGGVKEQRECCISTQQEVSEKVPGQEHGPP